MPRRYTITEQERQRRSENMRRYISGIDLSERGRRMNENRKKARDHNQAVIERLKKANDILKSNGLDTV